MITQISLKNFKAIYDASVCIKPLTVLAGLNGSGKSTVLQALSVLRQSYDSSGNTNGLQLGGALVHLGLGKDVLNEGAQGEQDSFSINVHENDTEFIWECLCPSDRSQLQFVAKPETLPFFIQTPGFQYLQADRITPHTLYPQAPQQARDTGFLGVRGEYTVDYLARAETHGLVPESRCYRNEDKTLNAAFLDKVAPTRKLSDQVAGWMQHLSPGVRINAILLSGTDEVQLQFNYVGHSRGLESNQYRPTNVGFGLTYSLPIVVACLSAPSGALLLIENPEAHLHPRGQAALGELLAKCSMDGVQVIVETHSDHLLNGIRLAVKRRIISAEQVAMHFFSRDIASGIVEHETPILQPNGRLSNWPEGFFDQWDKSIDALLD